MVEAADSESVDELLEEGNALEADVVKGVEDAGDADEGEVRTHGNAAPQPGRDSFAPSRVERERNGIPEAPKRGDERGKWSGETKRSSPPNFDKEA